MSKVERYEQQIREAVTTGNDEMVNLLAQCLVMGDAAKQVLRDRGYGWTGLDLLKTVELVPDNEE